MTHQQQEQYDGEDRRTPERWKIKKEVSLADLLSFACAALAVVYAYTTLDKRVTVVELSAIEQKAKNTIQDEEALRTQARIDVQLDRLNTKVDRLLERK
jgi:hypothetical protein